MPLPVSGGQRYSSVNTRVGKVVFSEMALTFKRFDLPPDSPGLHRRVNKSFCEKSPTITAR